MGFFSRLTRSIGKGLRTVGHGVTHAWKAAKNVRHTIGKIAKVAGIGLSFVAPEFGLPLSTFGNLISIDSGKDILKEVAQAGIGVLENVVDPSGTLSNITNAALFAEDEIQNKKQPPSTISNSGTNSNSNSNSNRFTTQPIRRSNTLALR